MPDATNPHSPTLDLTAFFPYRLAILAEAVSEAVAQIYADRFDLTRQEWRVLAALGNCRQMAAKQAGRACALDKMQVSRATQRLEARGLISRAADPADRRNNILTITAEGEALYRRIAPLALERQACLLGALSAGERDSLDRLMEKILTEARALTAG